MLLITLIEAEESYLVSYSSDKTHSLVITATYNEAENIEKFINQIIEAKFDLLIVDDSSPDGTANYVKILSTLITYFDFKAK